jgi:hypothetical protein
MVLKTNIRKLNNMDISQYILGYIKDFTSVIPYDDFSRICSFVNQTFKLSTEKASEAVIKEAEKLNLTVGSQEYATDRKWDGQAKVIPFGLGYRNLYNPLSAKDFKEGDRIELMYENGDLLGSGMITKKHNDHTFDVKDFAGEVHSKVPMNRVRIPLAKGRDVAPPQSRRNGDPLGYMDSPRDVGDNTVTREFPGEFFLPKGQEGQSVVNPPDLFYSSLIKDVQEKYGKDVSEKFQRYLEGKITEDIEVTSIFNKYGLKKVA